jgi:hypothetical protein
MTVRLCYEGTKRKSGNQTSCTFETKPRGDLMVGRKLIATAAVLLMISAPALVLAGSKGFSGSRGSGAFKSRPAPSSSSVKPEQGQSRTGTIQDLGVNPSTKSPGDMVRNRPGSDPSGMTPGAGPMPQAAAPGFFGSGGGFGSSWMTWGILGYIFGRSQSHPQKTAEKELELIPDPADVR